MGLSMVRDEPTRIEPFTSIFDKSIEELEAEQVTGQERITAELTLDKLRSIIFPKLVKAVYDTVRTMRVFDAAGVTQFYMIFTKTHAKDIKWWYLRKQGLIVKHVGFACDWAELPPAQVYITEDFWVCGCASHFIKHKAESRCKRCDTHFKNGYNLLETPNFMKGDS